MVLAVVMPLAVACSGIGPSSDSAEDGTITVAYVPDPTPMTAYLEGEVKRFEDANPELNVELRSVPADQYSNALELQFGQSQAPDIFRLQPGNQFPERAFARKWIRDLSEYANDDFQARFPEGTFDQATGGLYRDGQLIGVPLTDGSWTGSRALFYNPDLLAEYGYDSPPSTWEEMTSVARKISTDSGGEVYGFGLAELHSRVEEYSWSFGEPLMNSADSAGINPLTGQAGYSQENYAEAVEYFQQLAADNAVAPGWQNFKGKDLWPLFVNGQIAMFIAFLWNYPEVTALEPDFTVGTASIPGRDGARARVYADALQRPYWAISSRSTQPDNAWKFLDFLSTPESQARFYEATGAPPAIETELDADLRKVLDIGAETRILAPEPRYISPEGRKLADALSDKVKPDDVRNALAAAVGEGQPWAALAKQLDSDLNAAIDAAIAQLQADGVEVSRETLTFPEWDPNTDFTG